MNNVKGWTGRRLCECTIEIKSIECWELINVDLQCREMALDEGYFESSRVVAIPISNLDMLGL